MNYTEAADIEVINQTLCITYFPFLHSPCINLNAEDDNKNIQHSVNYCKLVFTIIYI